MEVPEVMRAWTFTRRGKPQDTLQLSTIPTPSAASLKQDEVLIKVSHVSLSTGFDIFFTLLYHLNSKPWIPEFALSGNVVGSSTDLKEGQEVIAHQTPAAFFKENGVLAQYVAVPRSMVVKKPKALSMAEAAAIPGSGVTALQACEIAGLSKGGSVLITGGSGGFGSVLVQVCRVMLGPSGRVVVTCSGQNAAMVKDLGADEVSASLMTAKRVLT